MTAFGFLVPRPYTHTWYVWFRFSSFWLKMNGPLDLPVYCVTVRLFIISFYTEYFLSSFIVWNVKLFTQNTISVFILFMSPECACLSLYVHGAIWAIRKPHVTQKIIIKWQTLCIWLMAVTVVSKSQVIIECQRKSKSYTHFSLSHAKRVFAKCVQILYILC